MSPMDPTKCVGRSVRLTNPAILSHVSRIVADTFSIPLEQVSLAILASKRSKAGISSSSISTSC